MSPIGDVDLRAYQNRIISNWLSVTAARSFLTLGRFYVGLKVHHQREPTVKLGRARIREVLSWNEWHHAVARK